MAFDFFFGPSSTAWPANRMGTPEPDIHWTTVECSGGESSCEIEMLTEGGVAANVAPLSSGGKNWVGDNGLAGSELSGAGMRGSNQPFPTKIAEGGGQRNLQYQTTKNHPASVLITLAMVRERAPQD